MSKTIKSKAAAAKSVTADNSAAATIAADFASFATAKRERVVMLTDALKTLTGADADDARAAITACTNRAERAERFAAGMQHEAYAQAVIDYGVNMQNATALQIYAQDKLHETLRAIGAGCALSAVASRGHANMMTQTLIAALDAEGPLTVKHAPVAMRAINPHKSAGTYSAQATSSRQTLDILGLLSWDALAKTFQLNERGEALRAILTR